MSAWQVDRLLREFEGRFDRAATVLARAPGRINLIGEHTDYNDGFALPIAIDRYTWVAARPRNDHFVRVVALDFGADQDEFVMEAQPPHNLGGGWRDYVRGGVARVQSDSGLDRGLDLMVSGDIPRGAGLSSSASLLLALMHAARAAHDLPTLDPRHMARLAQQAEVDFVGCRCGIMDQLASACGAAGHALLIDCRSDHGVQVPLPAGMALMAAHSGVRRQLVGSAYNDRRRDCETAAALLGVSALRDADLLALETARPRMPDLVYRRARHVVTENVRVLDFAGALARGDLERIGELMGNSQRSMRDDFEITVPAIDRLVTLLQSVVGTDGGARMTGGGFGGCVVAVLRESLMPEVLSCLQHSYRTPTGECAEVYRLHASEGAAWERVAEVC